MSESDEMATSSRNVIGGGQSLSDSDEEEEDCQSLRVVGVSDLDDVFPFFTCSEELDPRVSPSSEEEDGERRGEDRVGRVERRR